MDDALIELLPPVQRLALAYAPVRARAAWLAVLALDTRLGQLVRAAREPILSQIRLAWWRDRLAEDAADWPRGEPLLAALSAWHGQHGRLGGLVDGWELLLGEAPLPASALAGFAGERGKAMRALAEILQRPDAAEDAERAGAGWAIADLVGHLSDIEERTAALALATAHDWRRPRLPRLLRPLAIFHGLGAAGMRNGGTGQSHANFALALRLGLLGM